MLIMRPVVASEVPNDEPMSVSRPIGMNSDELKTKAARASPQTGRISARDMLALASCAMADLQGLNRRQGCVHHTE